MSEPRREFLHTERGWASRCELDREGYSVEASTDLGYRGGSATVCRELRLGRARPCNEQLYCSMSQHLVWVFGPLGRHMEAWHPIDLLPLGAQGLATGCQHANRGRAVHEPLSPGSPTLEAGFAIVEDDHHMLRPQQTPHT